MLTDLSPGATKNREHESEQASMPAVADQPPKRLSKRARGRVCLRKAQKAVRQTCTALAAEAREELVSALMPALWRRVRTWRPRDKSFPDFAEQAAFQSLKDCLRRSHSSRDALDRAAVGLEEVGEGI